jgi:dienelactone hydrolase
MYSLLLLSLGFQASPTPAPIGEGLAISVQSGPLADVRRDAVELAILDGSLTTPAEGQTVGGRSWHAVKADKDGWMQAGNGYLEVSISSNQERTVLISPEGASFFYVDGEPRTGDVYGSGYVAVPLHLKAGVTPIFLRSSRGRVRVLVTDSPKPFELDARDATLPDTVVGDRGAKWGALVVRNSSDRTVDGLTIETHAEGGHTRRTDVRPILPYGVIKSPMELDAPIGGKVEVSLLRRGKLVDRTEVTIRLRKPDENYKRTFISDIDGSVQYFGVNPARDRSANGPKPALVLSLHGAGVEGMGQADAYAGKSWLTLVAPTNRRPYGFDWEDWGRMDALEVLDQAKRQFPYDPERVYLAGHSMGGHGTWQIGALYPDLFAAIGPSAGWISSYTYAGARLPTNPSPIEKLLTRANAVSDTLGYKTNYAAEGIYALHGTADDNVPITEARHMIDEIKSFHHDYILHEQPGVGHWWNLSKEPGADCVDWAPMYDFFERHALPVERTVRDVDFSTANPQVSSKLRWLSIEQQEAEGAISRVEIRVDPHLRVYTATTASVARFSVGLQPLYGAGDVSFVIDGQSFKATPDPKSDRIYLVKRNGAWASGSAILSGEKGPGRYGPLRLAFNHRMVFVYGTHGTPEENSWALAKARYDDETFWYRGNGSPDVVSDTAFDLKKYKNRDVILYGNADTNSDWPLLLGGSPVQVRHGEISIGEKRLTGDGLTCLFLRPLAGSDTALVAAVSGTGLAGMRDSNNLPYLQPMIGFPDVLVTDRKALSDGISGIRAAGFFGADWGVPSGEFVYSE